MLKRYSKSILIHKVFEFCVLSSSHDVEVALSLEHEDEEISEGIEALYLGRRHGLEDVISLLL